MRNWALRASLIETCKLNAVDPYAWPAALQAIVARYRQNQIDDLPAPGIVHALMISRLLEGPFGL